MNRFTITRDDFDVASRLLDNLKNNLKITDNTRDDSLSSALVVATVAIENYCFRFLYEREILGEYSTAEPSRADGNKLMLPCWRAPVFDDALIEIKYRADPDDIIMEGYIAPVMEFGECFITNESEEIPRENQLYILSVKFKAGYKYTDSEWDCPPDLIDAVLSFAALVYSNPGVCGASGCSGQKTMDNNGVRMPYQIALKCNPYVIKRYDIEP